MGRRFDEFEETMNLGLDTWAKIPWLKIGQGVLLVFLSPLIAIGVALLWPVGAFAKWRRNSKTSESWVH